MALPVILGMPFIIGVAIKIIEWLITKFAVFFTKRGALISAYITFFFAAMASLVSIITGLMSGIVASMPEQIAQGLMYVKPDNLELVLTTYFSVRIALWVWYQQNRVMQLSLFK